MNPIRRFQFFESFFNKKINNDIYYYYYEIIQDNTNIKIREMVIFLHKFTISILDVLILSQRRKIKRRRRRRERERVWDEELTFPVTIYYRGCGLNYSRAG